MNLEDRLLALLLEFFELPADTRSEDIRQTLLPDWASLATVQLITEPERVFSVNFDIEDIVRFRSYQALLKSWG